MRLATAESFPGRKASKAGIGRAIAAGIICGVLLAGWFLSGVHAQDNCFNEMLTQALSARADLSGKKLEQELWAKTVLRSLQPVKLVEGRLPQDCEFTLVHEGEVKGTYKLLGPLVVEKDDWQRYRLPENTRIGYVLPPRLECTTSLPAGTELSVVSEVRSEFALVGNRMVEISPPANCRIALTVDAPQTVERIPGSIRSGTTLKVNPQRAPVGGYIELAVAKTGFEFAKARLDVAMRPLDNPMQPFSQSGDIELTEVKLGEAKFTARVPDIGESGIYLPKNVELVVLARIPGGGIAEVVSQQFSVSSRGLGYATWVLALLLSWVLLALLSSKILGIGFFRCLNPIVSLSGNYGRGSLSLAQILLWTILVFSASFYVLATSGKLLELNSDVLILLGIAGTSSVFANIAFTVKEEKGRSMAVPNPSNATWADLFRTEGQPDLSKVQMALFTIVAAAYVTATVFRTYQFPSLPEGLLILIGISNGVYLAAKASSQTVYQRLAEKHTELQNAKSALEKENILAAEAEKRRLETNGIFEEVQKDLKTQKDSWQAETDPVKKDNLGKIVAQREADLVKAQAALKEAQDKKAGLDASVKVAEKRVTEITTEFEDLKKKAESAT